MTMQDRLDPLIADRAPWLFEPRLDRRALKWTLDVLLQYRRTLRLGEALAPMPARRLMQSAARLTVRRLEVSGLSHIPRSGAALIVANHPTGIADGLALTRVLARRRPDAFFLANADILKVLPQLSEVIAPVEWRPERRSPSSLRDTMEALRPALRAGRLGVVFPSGRLAKRRGLRLHERPWMPSAARLAQRFDLPVIPVHIRARNSMLFYALDAIHPDLRDITLFHETLNKRRHRFRLTIGAPIPPEDLPSDPAAATDLLRRETLALGRAARVQSARPRAPLGRRARIAPLL